MVVVTVLPGAAAHAEPGRSRPASPITQPTRATERDAALVAWALGRFEAAGLQAPESAFVFSDSTQPCGGFDGRYYPNTDKVVICVIDSASDLVLRTLVLHEFAHAWTEQNLTETARARFVDLRGARSWNAAKDAWSERATEHAAVVMAWGLLDVVVQPRPIGDTSTAALTEAFRLLTGSDPINDGSAPSAQPTRTARTASLLS